jgi:electron transfer flavoprotein alpha subunit
MGATANGRDIAPRTASKLAIGLTADCTEIEIDETGQLLATRPTYGGELMATIISKTKPNFATIRPGVFKVSCSNQRNTNIHLVDNISNTNNQLIEYLENTSYSISTIAQMIGYKSENHFRRIFIDLTGTTPLKYRKGHSEASD